MLKQLLHIVLHLYGQKDVLYRFKDLWRFFNCFGLVSKTAFVFDNNPL